MNIPSISTTFKDTGAIDFSLEEADEADGEEAQNSGKEISTGSEGNKRSNVGINKDNQQSDVAMENIHEPPNEFHETSVWEV